MFPGSFADICLCKDQRNTGALMQRALDKATNQLRMLPSLVFFWHGIQATFRLFLRLSGKENEDSSWHTLGSPNAWCDIHTTWLLHRGMLPNNCLLYSLSTHQPPYSYSRKGKMGGTRSNHCTASLSLKMPILPPTWSQMCHAHLVILGVSSSLQMCMWDKYLL